MSIFIVNGKPNKNLNLSRYRQGPHAIREPEDYATVDEGKPRKYLETMCHGPAHVTNPSPNEKKKKMKRRNRGEDSRRESSSSSHHLPTGVRKRPPLALFKEGIPPLSLSLKNLEVHRRQSSKNHHERLALCPSEESKMNFSL